MTKYWITGVSGTGKTTVGKHLAKDGTTVVDIEEVAGLCRWENKETKQPVAFPDVVTKQFNDTHSWSVDTVKLQTLIDESSQPVFIVGMNDSLENQFAEFEKVFVLQCTNEVLRARLQSRTNNSFGKDNTMRDDVLAFHTEYETRLIKNGAIAIDANESVLEVATQVMSFLTQI